MSRLEELLEGAGSVALSGHIRPDGDCIGSVMSVYQYIKKNMPTLNVGVFLEEPAPVFGCIQGIERIDSHMDTLHEYDVFIALDCTSDRLGDALGIFNRAKKKINIDHHVSNQGCGDINILVPDASSTCEVVYELMDKEKIDDEIAKTIYIGMIHDIGVSADTAKRTVATVISCPAIPRKKTMRFPCFCSTGTDQKMNSEIALFGFVPFPLMR